MPTLALIAGLIVSCSWQSGAAPPDEEWAALEQGYTQAMDHWMAQMQKIEDQGGGMTMGLPGSMPPHPAEAFRPRVRAYAEKHAGQPAALPALGWLVINGVSFSPFPQTDPSCPWALKHLQDEYLEDPQIAGVVRGLEMAPAGTDDTPFIEFLEAVAAKNPDPEVQALAQVTLAHMLMTESPMAMFTGGQRPDRAPRARKILLAVVAKQPPDTELAGRARALLFQVEHLQVGKQVPDFSGHDVEGKEIKRSQFEGKVLAIVFWGTWCAPCMQMIPHEKEMVARLANEPFAMIGVNVHDDKATLRKAVEKEGISWPTIYDGMEGHITTKWGINAFPTIYIIDHQGIIRHKNVMPFQLESTLTGLIKEAKS